MDEKIPPLIISFKKNEKDKKLASYVDNKSCKAAWAKEAMMEKMEREESEKIQQKNNSFIQPDYGVQFKEDIL